MKTNRYSYIRWFATMFLSLVLSSVQRGWFWSNLLPLGNPLNGVSFVDASTGTAVGVAGTILCATNGGARWMNQSSGTANSLLSASFTDANTGTASCPDEWAYQANSEHRSSPMAGAFTLLKNSPLERGAPMPAGAGFVVPFVSMVFRLRFIF